MPCHRDCLNYAPVDVAKGICHRTKAMVPADADHCDAFVKKPKCAHCVNFAATPGKIELGVCNASKNEPKFMAFPDMSAVTCEFYKEH